MSSVVKSVGGAIGGIFGGGDDGSDAAQAATDAASIQAQAQQESLDYLKEINELPQELKEQALTQLAGIYGLEGGEGSQQDLIDRARDSPLYGSIMGTQKMGEDAIMRNASATGGLRSGNTQANMYDYNVRLANDALLQSYNHELTGLQGLSGLGTNEAAIAEGMAGIGTTTAQGMTAAAQAESAAAQNNTNNLLSTIGTGASLYGMYLLSDRALKTNIVNVVDVNGIKFYTWTWNKKAEEIGLFGDSFGVIADEVEHIPGAVMKQGKYQAVDYNRVLSEI